MADSLPVRSASRVVVYSAGVLAAAWATYSAATWLRYGRVQAAGNGEQDPLLDGFMPTYEVVERHRVTVGAPADVTYRAACDVNLQRSTLINAIFRGRELMMRARPDRTARPRGLLEFAKSIGWGVLAEVPGREIVIGAVTQPWQPDVVFNPLPPDRFASFSEPGYVKIVWTIRVDSSGPSESVARTETRVVATDPDARRRFRRYWSIYSPGILLIRHMLLQLVRADAERQAGELLWQH
jgi:hypothetical protein